MKQAFIKAYEKTASVALPPTLLYLLLVIFGIAPDNSRVGASLILLIIVIYVASNTALFRNSENINN